jgi:hypothetical protein
MSSRPKKGRPNKGKTVVRAPAAQNRSSSQRGQNSVRFRECERVGTVVGSVAFANVLNLPCNPALAGSFPWLAGHAALYESYRVHSLTYRYKNLKGTSSDGNILMSFDYDTLDEAPSTAVVLSQSTVWKDGAPWRIFEMKVPCHKRPLFTRSSMTLPGTDLKTYDFGRLFVAAEGCADTSDHGYLEVEYDVELFDKQNNSTSATAVVSSLSLFNLSTNAALGAPGIVPIDETVSNPLNIALAAGVFTLPVGAYLVTFEGSVSAATVSVDVRVDGAAQTPLCRSNLVQNGSASITAVVVSDGTTTVDIYDLTGGATYTGDRNRVFIRVVY